MRHLDQKRMAIIMESTPRSCRPYVKSLLATDASLGFDSFMRRVDERLSRQPLPDTRAIYPLYQGISWMLTTEADKLDAESSDIPRAQLLLAFVAGV